MSKKTSYFKDHKRRLAKMSISTSAFRRQGKQGLIRFTQNYINERIDLHTFAKALRSGNYQKYLDKQTLLLVQAAKKYNCRWGTARKGLNIFFRDVLYNSYFINELKLNLNHGWHLEIPLDSKTMSQIRRLHKSENLQSLGFATPQTTSIIALHPENSLKYQIAATAIAKAKYQKHTRVDLDMEFWTT
ncbi:hypothetical protein [Bdellovibrio bacteriovorus]|uniref:hypothetical protein n=1 Tax=Bdellovibrio bacteriovorus TaxID=959 RepID=UPI0005A191E1|nr:hypothetical protein [Bdellovibrio bacteriovorus]